MTEFAVDGSGPTSNGNAAEPPKLVFIPSGSPTPHAAELLGSKRFKQFVEEASAVYDLVVFDSSPLLAVSDTLEILPHVGAIALCAATKSRPPAAASA